MKLEELHQQLDALGYPVAYSHFNSTQKTPFICYLVDGDENFSADNTIYFEILNVDIELYVKKKDPVAENKIKKLLNDNELPYAYYEAFIKDEGVFQCVFSIQLTQ